jgi:hypothetical protein
MFQNNLGACTIHDQASMPYQSNGSETCHYSTKFGLVKCTMNALAPFSQTA